MKRLKTYQLRKLPRTPPMFRALELNMLYLDPPDHTRLRSLTPSLTIITEISALPAKYHDKFHRWSQAVVSLTSPSPTLRIIPSVWMFLRYLRHSFKLRRSDPQNDFSKLH